MIFCGIWYCTFKLILIWVSTTPILVVLEVAVFTKQHGNRKAEHEFSVSEKLVCGWTKI